MNWVDSYYESLEFLYWEPQHIGRKKNPEAKLNSVEKVSKHLRLMEVTLNHNLQQFFLLAPQRLRNRLFATAFGDAFSDPFMLHGRATSLYLTSSAQPDFVFTSERDVVFVEMKIGAKCSVSQILKYSLLGVALELKFGRTMKHHLLLMGAGEFCKQWRESFSVVELREAVLSHDLPGFMSKVDKTLRDRESRVREIAGEMPIAFLSYEGLATLLLNSGPDDTDLTDGAEVYRNLIGGMIGELRRRELVTSASAEIV
jgi:hypothetical protein